MKIEVVRKGMKRLLSRGMNDGGCESGGLVVVMWLLSGSSVDVESEQEK